MDKIKNLDCNQIKIFINLEIIGKEKLYIYIYIYFFFKKILKFKKISTIWRTTWRNYNV